MPKEVVKTLGRVRGLRIIFFSVLLGGGIIGRYEVLRELRACQKSHAQGWDMVSVKKIGSSVFIVSS